jgi:hypothetical protein
VDREVEMGQQVNRVDIAENIITECIGKAIDASLAGGAPAMYRVIGEYTAGLHTNSDPELKSYVLGQALVRLTYATMAADMIRQGTMQPRDAPRP